MNYIDLCHVIVNALVLIKLADMFSINANRKYKVFQTMAFFMICFLMNAVLPVNDDKLFAIEIICLILYIRIISKRPALWVLNRALSCYVIYKLGMMVVVFTVFPISLIPGVLRGTFLIEIIMIVLKISLIVFLYKILNKHFNLSGSGVQHTSTFILTLIVLSIFVLKSVPYRDEIKRLYALIILFSIVGCIIGILWIIDRRRERKRYEELSAYVHKSKEVLPSIGKAVSKLENVIDNPEESKQIVKELKSISFSELEENAKKDRSLKTFASTGSIILDEQLERYLDETNEAEIELDILVGDDIKELLESKVIVQYSLHGLIGNLYRNAYRAVLKTEESVKRILICMGYTDNHIYEIAVYDNGVPFPDFVLKNLGVRGTTTDGTGNGMAEIFEALEESHASLTIDENQGEHSIFTKGIYIRFDERHEIRIQ